MLLVFIIDQTRRSCKRFWKCKGIFADCLHFDWNLTYNDTAVSYTHLLLHSRDAIVRVTRSAICTSDLHIRNGAVPRAVPGVILGHEFVGEVISVGTGITSLYPGERGRRIARHFVESVGIAGTGM